MQLEPRPNVACSAPGKVLLAGGYLVLDRAYTGLVLGLDAHIYVLAQTPISYSELGPSQIVVRSPQFKNAEWRYEICILEDGVCVNLNQLIR